MAMVKRDGLGSHNRTIVRRLMVHVARPLLILLSLALSFLSLPGGPLPLLAFGSLVPFGIALHNTSRRESFLYAYVCGFLGWIMFTPGLIAGLSSYTHVSSILATSLIILGCGWLALPYGLFGVLYGRFRWMNRCAGPIKAAACLTLLVNLFPSPLPLDSSHSLYEFPRLLQLMDLGGQPLLLFILYLFNWLLVDVALKLKERRSVKTAIAWIVGIAILIMGYGSFRLTRSHEHAWDSRLKIAIIQPNIPVIRNANLSSLGGLQTLLNQSTEIISHDKSIDLITWPEISARINCEAGSQTNLILSEFAAEHRVPLLINCTQLSSDGREYNTELFIAVDGTSETYHKQILFPFTEFIPGEQWFPDLRTLFPGASRYEAGTKATVFPIKNSFVFPAICYEILFPSHSRRFVQHGGNILVSPANDAWFGANRIPHFEVAAAVFQAIQHRIPVVRVSNSGNSVAVQATGEIAPNSRTPNFIQTTRTVELYAPPSRPPYSSFRNNFVYLLALVWLVSVAMETLRRRKSG
ncbi:MAG: apolipoprotein N-acyltransferase [Pyrinomonadaceae bacterium]